MSRAILHVSVVAFVLGGAETALGEFVGGGTYSFDAVTPDTMEPVRVNWMFLAFDAPDEVINVFSANFQVTDGSTFNQRQNFGADVDYSPPAGVIGGPIEFDTFATIGTVFDSPGGPDPNGVNFDMGQTAVIGDSGWGVSNADNDTGVTRAPGASAEYPMTLDPGLEYVLIGQWVTAGGGAGAANDSWTGVGDGVVLADQFEGALSFTTNTVQTLDVPVADPATSPPPLPDPCEAGWRDGFGDTFASQEDPRPLVAALEVFDDGMGPILYAGGSFRAVNGMSRIGVRYVARFDGVDWESLTPDDPGRPITPVTAMTVFDDGTGPALFVGSTQELLKWDGAQWFDVTAQTDLANGDINALAVFDDGSGAALYAAGEFTAIGGVAATRIARWDGGHWSALGTGLDGVVHDLEVFDDGSGPALYAGGEFEIAGQMFADLVAKWDGAQWAPVGSGVAAAPSEGAVARAVYDLRGADVGTGPLLFAGGDFNTIDAVIARRLAAWDGTTWSEFGGGVDDATRTPSVRAIEIFNDGAGEALYIAGTFDVAGATLADNIARWDGAGWSALGAGLKRLDGAVPTSMLSVSFNGGVPADLYVGGNCGLIGAGVVNSTGVVRWRGCPAPPGGFALLSPAPGTLGASLTPTLQWQASAGAEVYIVTLGTAPDLTGDLLVETLTTETTFPIESGLLDREVSYYWSVEAINSGGAVLAAPGIASFKTIALADLNSDGEVDGADLGLLLQNWGPCPDPPDTCPADISGVGDGVINGADLGVLLQAWTE